MNDVKKHVQLNPFTFGSIMNTAKRLKENGYYVICVDWKTNEFMQNDEFCNEFIHDDLRKLEVACKACVGCTQVYNLAADMGGMGFIVSNESVLAFNNTAISMNMLEAARRNGVKDFFYFWPWFWKIFPKSC